MSVAITPKRALTRAEFCSVSTDWPAAMKIITTTRATPKYKPIEASTKIKISFQLQRVRRSSGNCSSCNSCGVGAGGALRTGVVCSGGGLESEPDILTFGLSAIGFNQRRCKQRHEDFVMAGDGDSLRAGAARAAGCRTFYHILHRAIVLDEIEIGCSDGHERRAEIAGHRHGLQENLRQHYRRTPV